ALHRLRPAAAGTAGGRSAEPHRDVRAAGGPDVHRPGLRPGEPHLRTVLRRRPRALPVHPRRPDEHLPDHPAHPRRGAVRARGADPRQRDRATHRPDRRPAGGGAGEHADPVLVTGLAVVVGYAAAGSVLIGTATGLTGMVFAGIAAVTSQLTEFSRTATGTAGIVLAIAFVLRALGDMVAVGGSTLSWASPLGWAT